MLWLMCQSATKLVLQAAPDSDMENGRQWQWPSDEANCQWQWKQDATNDYEDNDDEDNDDDNNSDGEDGGAHWQQRRWQ